MKAGCELKGKRILAVGLARTGLATALFCAARGARVTATDERAESELREAAERLAAAGCVVELGGHHEQTFLAQDLIIPSPGVPSSLPALDSARVQGIPVWSESELAWRFLSGRLVAITGSNGKTTTTSLVGHILEKSGVPTIVAGNIGVPLISRVETSSDSTITVVEASSFQLENIISFRPEVGVLLDLTPDHLERHGSLEEYWRAKARLFENQTESEFAVLNADDPGVTPCAPSRPQLFWFSRAQRVASGAFLRGEDAVFRREGAE